MAASGRPPVPRSVAPAGLRSPPPRSVVPAGVGGKIGKFAAGFGLTDTTFTVVNRAGRNIIVFCGATPFSRQVSSASLGVGQVAFGVTFTSDPAASLGVQQISMSPGQESKFTVQGAAGRVTVVYWSLSRKAWLIVRKDREVSNGEKYVVSSEMIQSDPLGTWVGIPTPK